MPTITREGRTLAELLEQLRPDQALCAFNAESFDTLRPAVVAAAELGCPVVVAFSVPAARYLGYELTYELVSTLARHYGVVHALHLDHCESPDEARAAVDAGFGSVNLLDEGALGPERYLAAAQQLRADLHDRAAFEFVAGTLGHVEHAHDGIRTEHPGAAEIAAFAEACQPDVLGFDCGSLHGMARREQAIDVDLVRAVSTATGLPIVLHGASGVDESMLLAGIDAGIRKVNIETAMRATYMATLRAGLDGGGDAARKPRALVRTTDDALTELYTSLLRTYTLREA